MPILSAVYAVMSSHMKLLRGAAALLAVTAIFLSGCGSSSKDYITQMYESRMAQFRSEVVPPGQPMMIGDSITQLWGDEPNWPAGWTNRGIGGDKTDGVLARLQEHLAAKPSKVILLIGTNELSYESAHYMSNIRLIYDQVKAAGVPLTVVSLLPRQDGVKPNDEVNNYNTLLADFCTRNGIAFLNIHDKFLLQDGSTDPSLFNGVVHPNSAGYVTMAGLFGEAFSQ